MADERQWDRAGLIALYKDAVYDPEVTPAAFKAVTEWAAALPGLPRLQRRGLWLGGPPGVGKTHLAHLAAEACLDAGMKVRLFTIQGYMDLFRRRMDAMALVRTGDREASDDYWVWERQIRAALTRTEVVVIDDLGKEHTTSTRFAQDEIERLVRARGNHCLPTIVTTNQPRSAIGKIYGESFDSYIDQAFITVPVTAEDQRRVRR